VLTVHGLSFPYSHDNQHVGVPGQAAVMSQNPQVHMASGAVSWRFHHLLEAWMRVPPAFVKNGVKEAGHCLKKLQYERLDHPDYHPAAVLYEVPYPVTKLTSLCTIMIINWSVTVGINCVTGQNQTHWQYSRLSSVADLLIMVSLTIEKNYCTNLIHRGVNPSLIYCHSWISTSTIMQ